MKLLLGITPSESVIAAEAVSRTDASLSRVADKSDVVVAEGGCW